LNKGIYVAICGKKNSGKNTLAATLQSAMLGHSHIIALADPIKEIGQKMFPWSKPTGWWGSSEERDDVIPDANDNQDNPLTYRQVLIDIGTQARRYNPLHWVNVFDHTFGLIVRETNGDGCIVSDVRFRNEFDYLHNKGFYLIKLMRNGITSSTDVTETNQDQIKLEDYDKVIHNNGTLNQLKRQVDDLMPSIIDHQNSR
jgi:hypothetical protein